jgi:hypothetical protein
MNRIRRQRRSLACLPRRAGALAAFAAAPAARRPDSPFLSGWNDYLPLPPGWRKHPPLPLGHVAGPVYKVPAQIPTHTTVAGGMPGWQITLTTATAVLLAAALVLAVYRMQSRQGPRPAAMSQLPKQPGHAGPGAAAMPGTPPCD